MKALRLRQIIRRSTHQVAELLEGAAEEHVDGGLGAVEALGDFGDGQAVDEPQVDHSAIILGQLQHADHQHRERFIVGSTAARGGHR